jgi:hypothetical protein
VTYKAVNIGHLNYRKGAAPTPKKRQEFPHDPQISPGT